jgi:putative transposase
MARTEPWKVSDEFWEKIEPLIPPAPSHARGGRTRMDDRDAFAAMIYVLRTGIQWNALPREMGASSTVHDRYQEWERLGFFEELWRAGLLEYDELEGIEWEWQALDGAMTKAPLGRGASGEAIGKNPTDRAKMGTKRSMLTDGAGIPLAVAVEGANRHDSKLLVATLDGLVVARPAAGPGEEEEEASSEQHLCLDAAYDSDEVRKELEARSYEPHISAADNEKRSERKEARRHLGGRARRWVVERTHSWLNRSRRLLVRWEKKPENYLGFIHLACAQLIFSKILVSG